MNPPALPAAQRRIPDPLRRRHGLAALAGVLAAFAAGCGGVHVTADNPMPQPLIEELPLRAGIYYSADFRKYEAKEKRASTDWQVELGAAHVAAIDRLTRAMFASVTQVPELTKPPEPPLDLILEPRFEEYSFLTPHDAGAELFAVTIKYRINVYDGAGRLIDSLVLTGFGNEVAGSLTSTKPLAAATRKAMRDAGAKFAAEFPDQPVVKKLLRHEPVSPLSGAASVAASEGAIGEVSPQVVKPVTHAPPAPASPASSAAPASPGAAGATPGAPSAATPASEGAAPEAAPATTGPAAAPAPGSATPAEGAAPSAGKADEEAPAAVKPEQAPSAGRPAPEAPAAGKPEQAAPAAREPATPAVAKPEADAPAVAPPEAEAPAVVEPAPATAAPAPPPATTPETPKLTAPDSGIAAPAASPP